ncbi:MAG: hypothetical protein WAW39_20855 [Prosthecobacter sp.]|uniref:hypothetical protein n=1 Tax=Prosthecobacter sp. TaxID=1965333 RepID=UPI003BB222D7
MSAEATRVPISDKVLTLFVDEYTAQEAAAVIRAINGTPEPVQEIIKVTTSWAEAARSVLTTLIWAAAIVSIIWISHR